MFASIDPEYAAKCRAAADRSWTWLEAHPADVANDPFYPDPGAWQEVLWARAERARVDPGAAARVLDLLRTHRLQPLSWSSPQLFGYVGLALDPNLPPDVRRAARDAIVERSATLAAASERDGHGVTLSTLEYGWESNETVMMRAATLAFAFHVSGEARLRRAALAQLHYLLGRNALARSFVVKHGARARAPVPLGARGARRSDSGLGGGRA